MAVGYSTGVLMLWDLLRREFITALLFHSEMVSQHLRSDYGNLLRRRDTDGAVVQSRWSHQNVENLMIIIYLN